MVKLAIQNAPLFAIDTRELEKNSPSYTIETLVELRQEIGPENLWRLLLVKIPYCRLINGTAGSGYLITAIYWFVPDRDMPHSLPILKCKTGC